MEENIAEFVGQSRAMGLGTPAYDPSSPSGDVAHAIGLASSPAVQSASGHALTTIQPAAARWRQTVGKVIVTVVRWNSVVAEGSFKPTTSPIAEGNPTVGDCGDDAGEQKCSLDEGGMEVPFEWVSDELLEIIFTFADPKTLMLNVPRVCKHWRQVCQVLLCNSLHLLLLCQALVGVHLDFRWWNTVVPPNALTGVDTPFVRRNMSWMSGLCRLFPLTSGASFKEENSVTVGVLMALAEGCPALTSVNLVNFGWCRKLTDVSVMALATGQKGAPPLLRSTLVGVLI
jgi:hypothetical protein